MKKIKLSQAKNQKNKVLQFCTFVDDHDYEWLNQWKWCIKKSKNNSYVTRTDIKNGRRSILMHRLILGLIDDPKIHVDHIDHDGLNNQRNNLRIANFGDNKSNCRSAINSSSKFLGVSLTIEKRKKKNYKYWVAQIQKNGKNKRLGRFKNEIDAAIAYNEEAKIIHGEFANLNKLD